MTLIVFISLMAASVEPILIKIGYQGAITPLQLITYRNVVAALTVLTFTIFKNRSWKVGEWIGLSKFLLTMRVALLLLGTNAAMLFALKFLPAVMVITAVTTTPALVALVNQWRGHDQLNAKFWMGFSLCFLGVILTVGAFNLQTFQIYSPKEGHHFHPFGLIALMTAMTSSTLYRTQMDNVTKVIPPRTISTYIFSINATLVTLFILPFIDPMPLHGIKISLWIGMAAALANLSFIAAIHHLGSTQMSIFDMLQRPLVILLAALILREPLSLSQIGGILLVLVGIRMSKVKRRN